MNFFFSHPEIASCDIRLEQFTTSMFFLKLGSVSINIVREIFILAVSFQANFMAETFSSRFFFELLCVFFFPP